MSGVDHGESGLRERSIRLLRGLRADLFTLAPQPLPPMSRPRVLRWLPHVLVVAAALLSVRTTGDYLAGAALVLALWRPLPAWCLSLGAQLLLGVLRFDGSTAPGARFDPALLAHAGVLLLVALRVPTRVAVEVLVVSVSFPYLVAPLSPSGPGLPDPLAGVVFTIAVLIGVSLRGRREARKQLVRQETVTAEERARRALLEERTRIARELHDVVAHHMSVISIQAQAARYLTKDPSPELTESLRSIRANAVEALTELRRVLGVLRAEDSGTDDVPQPTLDRLETLVGNARAAGLTVTTDTTGEARPLPAGVELSAYRIVQEALSNAIRHAPGCVVRVGIAYGDRALGVRVTNTPPDRPAPPSPGAGHGLLGMRERAAMLGGGLTAGPTPDGGYEVTAQLPDRTDTDV